MNTSGRFDANQPSSISVKIVTWPPALAISISACPSGLFTATAGTAGLRGRSSVPGTPQIVVQMPQWMSMPGLMAMTPIAPELSNSDTSAGLAKPSLSTILPVTLATSSAVEANWRSKLSSFSDPAEAGT